MGVVLALRTAQECVACAVTANVMDNVSVLGTVHCPLLFLPQQRTRPDCNTVHE